MAPPLPRSMDLLARIADAIIPVFLIVAIGCGYMRRQTTDVLAQGL